MPLWSCCCRFDNRWAWFLAVAFLLMVRGEARARPIGEKPNILLILTDDQGWGDLHSHGNEALDTPVLDTLAEEGARFEHFYVSPNCAPTRASLLTGRYHYRTGVTSVSRGEEVMHAHEVTLAEVLKGAGYATGCFGKWHNGANYPHHPMGQGFDEFVGLCQGHWNHYFDATLERNGEEYPTKGFVTDVLTDEAIAFMERNREQPFFCYVPYNTPHSPFQSPDALFEKYKARGLDGRTASVYAMVESVDANVGRLLGFLDEHGLAKNTIVWFLSDNGPALGKKPENQRYNGRLYGAKGSVHEGGVRVPSFLRWPGHVTAGVEVERIAAHIDVLPTLVELAGLGEVQTLPLDGMSLVPLFGFDVTQRRWPNRILFTAWTPPGYDTDHASLAARTDRWLAVRDPRWARKKPDDEHEDNDWELYDLIADPYQQHDVADDYPYLVRDMSADISFWRNQTTRYGFEPIPTEIGHPEWPETRLRAQDAALPPEWKTRRGNNSWLEDWKSASYSASWPVDVVRAGEFEVRIDYTLKKENAGCRYQVSSAGEVLEFVLEEAFAPVLVSDRDQAPRNEHSGQTWKTLSVGRLNLEEGPQTLTIRPLEIPGGGGMELLQLRVVAVGDTKEG